MNHGKGPVNSQPYWEGRFKGDWDEAGGPEQTRFFARLGLDLIPAWVREDIGLRCSTLADVGCAEGEGAALLKVAFPLLSVSGFDFSEAAISKARARHPHVEFHVKDIAAIDARFDVVFCSNVIEHFEEPRRVVDALAAAAGRYLVIMVPGWEIDRHPEHHVTFRLDDLPRMTAGLHLAHLAAVNCARIDRRQWPGYQLVAVYACADALAINNLSAGDLVAASQLPDLEPDDFVALRDAEPRLLRLADLSSARLLSSDLVSGLSSQLEQIRERQEAIGFNSRHELLESIGSLRDRIASIDEIADLRRDRERLEAERSALDQERNALARELLEARLGLQEIQERHAAAEGRATALEDELAHCSERALVAERLVAVQEQRATAAEQALAEQRNLAAAAAATLAELTVKNESLTNQIEERKQLMKQLEDSIDNLSAHVQSLDAAVRASLDQSASRQASDAGLIDAWRRYANALDEDRVRLAEQSALLQRLVLDLRASTSWKLTAPLRWASRSLLGKSAPDDLPMLQGPSALSFPSAPPVAQLHAPLPYGHPGDDLTTKPRDLTWDEFSEQVLSRREQYRGVFVQELVIDWSVPLYQRPQHIAAALGRIGYLVVYVTDNWAGDDVQGFRQVARNVWLTNSRETSDIPGAIRSVYSTAYANDPDRFFSYATESIFVYEYIDHIDPQISGEPENIVRLMKLKNWAFGGGADLIVASARVLEAEAIAAVGPDRVALVPNGVDTRHYRDPAQDAIAVPEALSSFRSRHKTVVGYFGAIAPWLWYDAITELVASRPDIGFVFIGPDYYGGTERLPRAENVLYLGTVDYKVLPAHARLFDVCFIPFEPGEIARTTSPLKLFEYFALEKPVVVTADMVECVAHQEVFCGGSVEELSAAIDAAVAVKDCPNHQARLRQLADENDWDRRAETLARAIEGVFQRRARKAQLPS